MLPDRVADARADAQVMASFCEAVESDMTMMFDAPGAYVLRGREGELQATTCADARLRSPLLCFPDFRARITAYFQGSEVRLRDAVALMRSDAGRGHSA